MNRPAPAAGRAGPDRDTHAANALRGGDLATLEQMAADWRTAPEVLFVLSQTPVISTRAKVAANPSTPEVANELLLNDAAMAVRAELGRKIAALLPELTGPDSARLRDAAAAKLLILARDGEVTVRRALSNAVARLDCIPKELAATLVRDVDTLVAVPIAEYSPLLDDDDLIALIAEAPSAVTLSAIARREGIATNVADRLIDVGVPTVMSTLLRNPTAQLRESALDRLVDHAVTIDELRAPLVERPELTERLVLRLGEFVSTHLIAELARRHGLSAEIRDALKARLEDEMADQGSAGASGTDESDILDAASRHAEGPVIAGLAARAGIDAQTVKRVFAMRMAKATIALAWQAGLSMDAAVALQVFPGRIPQSRRITAADDGGYPIAREELEWHLSALGIGTVAKARED